MSTIQDKGKEYLGYGLSILFLREEKTVKEGKTVLLRKRPAVSTWTPLQSKPLDADEIDLLFKKHTVRRSYQDQKTGEIGIKFISDPVGVGIITGAVSGNLEVVDVDTKHDDTGTLWDQFSTLLQDNLPELYPSLVIARTVSGGYHIYYRCKEIEGSVKLAIKENNEVLIETRGEGGYVVAPPTTGYEYLQGSPGEIPTITVLQRETIINIAQGLTQKVPDEDKPKPRVMPPKQFTEHLSPWEDWNYRGDIVGLLESHGWSVVRQRGERIYLLRPGKTDSKTSANFHTSLRTLFVFTTSTQFTAGAHGPGEVFSLLECDRDTKLAYRRLLDMGYGESWSGTRPAPTQAVTTVIRVEGITTVNKVTPVTRVISSPGNTLKVEDITGDEVMVTSPGPEATEEVLRALEVVEQSGRRCYVKEGDLAPVREYEYRLQTILGKYDNLLDEAGDLTSQDRDRMLEEIVRLGATLEPLDRDQYRTLFMAIPWVQEKGITREGYQEAVKKLTVSQEEEEQTRALKKLSYEFKGKLDTGDKAGAIALLKEKVREVETATGKGLLPPVYTYDSLLEEIATTPMGLKTGYPELDEIVSVKPGAITLVAGKPSHGKTTLMFNMMLEMAELYPDKTFYFFTYEEPIRNLSIKILDRLTGVYLKDHYRDCPDRPTSNYEFLKWYVKHHKTDITEVENGKRKLQELIDGQRIKLVANNYSVEELSRLIPYLQGKGEKIGAVYVDYIQRMRTERRVQGIREEMARISDTVLQIAKSTGLPIILGAQFNREVKGRPGLDNLKEAGNLAEDANTVIRVWDQAREDLDQGLLGANQGEDVKLEITTIKNREGEVNTTAFLLWDKRMWKIKTQRENTGRDYYQKTGDLFS